MKSIQIVLDTQLLMAADRAAKRAKIDRSTLIRDALRMHLKRLKVQELEDCDRAGYMQSRLAQADARSWESLAVWPED